MALNAAISFKNITLLQILLHRNNVSKEKVCVPVGKAKVKDLFEELSHNVFFFFFF